VIVILNEAHNLLLIQGESQEIFLRAKFGAPNYGDSHVLQLCHDHD
jgi:hypothetical protein